MLADEKPVGHDGLPENLVNFAEALGVLLSLKLNETLKATFAIEAKRLGIEMRRGLKESRYEIPLDESECVVEDMDDLSKSNKPVKKLCPPNPSLLGRRVSTRSSLDEVRALTSSDTGASPSHTPSHTPSQLHRRRRRQESGKLERQLEEKIITAKLLNNAGNSELSLPHSRNPGRKQSFKAVLPEGDVEGPVSKNDSLRNEMVLKVDASSSSSAIPRTSQAGSSGLHFSTVSAARSSEDAFNPDHSCHHPPENNAAGLSPSSRRRSTLSSSLPLTRWKNEATQFYDHKHTMVGESCGAARKINSTISRALGLLPWHMELVLLSKMYQIFFFLALLGSTWCVVAKFPSIGADTTAVDITTQVDDILAVGSLLGFLVSLVKNRAYIESQFLVESYLSRAGFLDELNCKSCVENGALLLVWLSCVASRIYADASEVSLHDICFLFNILTLLGICAHLLRILRGLHFTVDYFCEYVTERDIDFEDAMQEWFLLHCTVRTACASLQWCFVVFQLIAMGTVLLIAFSVITLRETIEEMIIVTLIPGVLCLMVLLRLSLSAAFVSDICRRVPMLVNASKAEFNLQRMYLVDYIHRCETGFYIFEVRLSSGMLLKSFYLACAAAVGFLTQVWRGLT